MSASLTPDRQTVKNILKAAWATAAPAVIPFVLLLTSNLVDLLNYASLSRLGIGSILVLFLCLAYLFRRGWWIAGLPSLLVFAGAMVFFALKFFRPYLAYIQANPPRGFHDYFSPLLMLSPSLVVVVVSLTLSVVLIRGMQACRFITSQPAGRLFWGIAVLWSLLLVGDYWYQSSGWRYFDQPSDMVVRLCSGDKAVQAEAKERLLKIGVSATPVLLEGMAAPDPDLECMREGCEKLIKSMDRAAVPGLLAAAKEGNETAVLMLGKIGAKRAVEPLRKLLKNPPQDSPPGFKKSLEKTLELLGATVSGQG